MARRPTKRQALSMEGLESRQLLSGGVAPTGQQQYMLELINLVRTNPRAGAERITSDLSATTRETLDYYGVNLSSAKQAIADSQARQPLAWNDSLAGAAQAQSRDMAANGFQSHTGSDGSSPDQRIDRAGYGARAKSAENAFAYADSVDQAMQAFTLDWGVADRGHFRNLLEPGSPQDDTFKEVGIGIVDSTAPGLNKVVTQNFGLRSNSPSMLLGVAYNDNDHDDFYSVGEGQGGVTIKVEDGQGKVVGSTQTGAAGGYQLPLAPGRYKVQALVGDKQVRSQDINIGQQNAKVDFVLSDPWTPAPTPQPTPTPVVVATPPQVVTTPPVKAEPPQLVTTPPVTTPTNSQVAAEPAPQVQVASKPEIVSVPADAPKTQAPPENKDEGTVAVPAQAVKAMTIAPPQEDSAGEVEEFASFVGSSKIDDWDYWDAVPMA